MFTKKATALSTPRRARFKNLDNVPLPDRSLFDNQAYKRYYLDKFGYSTSSIITSRGCPFSCDFCSRPIFGADMRTRSVGNIVDDRLAGGNCNDKPKGANRHI